MQGTAAATNLVRVERETRRFWQLYETVEACRRLRQGAEAFRFVQQPADVAGHHTIDQARLLVSADVLARYHSMRGRRVVWRTGWSCHEPSVELAVIRAMRDESDQYDLDAFGAACRRVATTGLEQSKSWADRLGVWLDPEACFSTLEPQSVSAVWSALRRIWDAGQLRKAQVVAPACPRCGAAFRPGEELAHRAEVDTRAVWVRLPWDEEVNTYFLTWTEAPWMLLDLVALAVNPDATYVVLRRRDPPEQSPVRLVMAEEATERLSQPGWRRVRRLSGKTLRGMRYRPLFTFASSDQEAGRVILSSDVPPARGTGIWPVTPDFDTLSQEIASQNRLSSPGIVDKRGVLGSQVVPWQGFSPLDAEPLLLDDLRSRGLVVQERHVRRTESGCPHCGAPVLPLTRAAWLAGSEGHSWVVGREALWGVPLPIWVCDTCGKEHCVAGLDDLVHHTGRDVSGIDPHRPGIDRFVFACDSCNGTMRRIPEVVDPTFELVANEQARGPEPEPLRLAVGSGERTGWLSLIADSARLWPGSASPGRALAVPPAGLEPAWDPERLRISDAVRWAALTETSPEEAERGFVRPLWGLALTLSSELAPAGPANADPGLTDRWLRARIAKAVRAATGALEAVDLPQATAALADLLDDALKLGLARRSMHTSTALDALSRLVAPFVPHLAEAMHRLEEPRPGESVHLTQWPEEVAPVDGEALAQVEQLRVLAALGDLARRRAGLGRERRLPLAIVGRLTPSQYGASLPEPGLPLQRALSVNHVEMAEGLPAPAVWRMALHPEQAVQRSIPGSVVEAALAALDSGTATQLVAQLRSGYSAGVEVEGRAVTLLPLELAIALETPTGWAAAEDGAWAVVLQIGS